MPPDDTSLTDTDTAVLEAPEGGSDAGSETLQEVEQAAPGAEGAAAEEPGEVVVTIGDEPAPADDGEQGAPSWVKDLRKANRQKDRELREKDAEIARLRGAGQQQQAVVLGEKPDPRDFETWTDEGADKFSAAVEAWHDRKRAVEQQERQRQDADAKARSDWQKRLDAFSAGKTALKVKDYDDAEATVQEHFNTVQQGVILDGAENAALLVYALGKNPAKAKELAGITNPVRFAFAVAKLEAQLKVTERKAAPIPERVIRGGVPVTAGADAQLTKLRAEADRTGDRSKVSAYLREQSKRAA